MRVLHVVPNLWRCNGVMSVVMNYLRNMPEDIRFDVLYFDELPDNYRDELETLGGRAYRVAPPGLHSFRHDDVDEFLNAHRGEYAAIHLHLPFLASVFAPKARKYGIPKVLVHCHSTWYSLDQRNILRNRLLNVPTKRLADTLIACGRDAGRFWYGDKAMREGQVKVLPNAVVCDKYRYSPQRRTTVRAAMGLCDALVVGHVGRVSPPQKNHPFLFRVFAEIARTVEHTVLLLAGAERCPELEALAAELGIEEHVQYLGLRSDVPDLLQAMDLFLFPSFYEGLPVAVVEAQSAGLPVLMSDTVTDEVCATDRIERLPLSNTPAQWAGRALALAALPRQDTADQVVSAGFDLKESAQWLASEYTTDTIP